MKLIVTYSKAVLLIAVIFLTQEIQAQDDRNTPDDWWKTVKTAVNPYGRLHLGAGFAESGEIGISNNAPRVGLRLKHPLLKDGDKNLNIIGRIELGLNLTSRDETIPFVVDPGAGVLQIGDPIFTRLGFVGVSYGDFEFTFGKQNSVYYELGASWVDRSQAFGGASIGVWNIGDGGVSGTGRANQVFKLKYKTGGLQLGAQAQTRFISDNNATIDTYGFAASYSIKQFSIGVGYNKVEDGVEDPLPDQAAVGDEAFVTSASYVGERLTLAVSYSDLKQHQKVGDIFYDAWGTEFYAGYFFSKNKRWKAGVGYNYLNPKDGENVGDFNTSFVLTELSYVFKPGSSIYAAARLDGSKNTAGSERNESIYGIGIKLDF